MCLPGTVETVRATPPAVTRRAVLAGGAAAGLAALTPGDALAHKRRKIKPKGRVADLTHTFTTDFPVYVGEGARRRTLNAYDPDGFYAQEWTFGEHTGTHMDAPGHFVEGNRLTPDIPPRELVVPIVVLDIRRRAAEDPDAEVTPDDIRRFERRHGRIPRGALVAMDSGWDAKLGTDEFLGRDAGGVFHFPGFGADAVEVLIKRKAGAIGVDTLSLDPGPSTTFAAHVAWLGTNRYGLENLAGLGTIPPHGAVASVGVVPWQEGSGGPLRVLATY